MSKQDESSSSSGSERKKGRAYSEDAIGRSNDYLTLPEIQIDSDGAKRRSNSFGNLPDGCVASRMPRSRSYDSVLFDFREVAAEDFASQLTLLDLKLFKAISIDELISGEWEGKEKVAKAPNVVEFSRRFNNVTFWTQRELLGTESVKSRVEVLRHFIKIAKKLYELNDLHSMMAVVLALQSAPIHRLIQTWRQVPNKDKRTFQKLDRLVSVANNRQALRDHLASTSLPCIPYFGMYLQDLLYMKAMSKRNPATATAGGDPQRDNILRTIVYFQSSEYRHIEPLYHIQKYLLSVEYMEEMQKFVDDNNFKLSLLLEPAGSEYRGSPGSDKLPRRVSNGHPRYHSESSSDIDRKSSTLPLLSSRGGVLPDGFLSPHTKTRRKFAAIGKTRTSPAVDTETLLKEKAASVRKHKKYHSLGRILDIEFPLDQCRISCLEPLDFPNSDMLHTPLASADELSSSESDESETSFHHSSLSTIASGDKGESSDEASYISLDQRTRDEDALFEGYLKRKTIRKYSKRVYRPRWSRCWGIVESGFFLLYDSSGVSGKPERSSFKAKPRSCLHLGGCTVAASTSPQQKPVFTLTDDKGTVRKFFTSSVEEMEKWVDAILKAIKSHKKEEAPLIHL
ncbi:ras-specific guanine nucleotide-releasing factor RalGPS2-like [Oscarella lobularis]|uniref:ras-specific guanine nucleotide-releasing factor RalGPS2-like n=1 Tax=Oscarella lobularis TaxID=121494 RepID=UPI00331416DC